MKAVAAAVALAALAAPAMAQERAERPRREAARDRVERHFEQQIKEGLGLGDEQQRRVLPLMRRMHENRRALRSRRAGALQDLREALASGTATEGQVAEVVDRVRDLERQEADTFLRDRNAVDAQLTPVQQGKLRLIEADLERKIRAFRSRRDRGWRGKGRPQETPPPRER